MNESFVIIACTILFSVGFMAFCEWLYGWIMSRPRKEKGPWVVTRVNASVNGGVEFFQGYWPVNNYEPIWTITLENALRVKDLRNADNMARDLCADVAPLSKYTGVDRG